MARIIREEDGLIKWIPDKDTREHAHRDAKHTCPARGAVPGVQV